MKKTVLILGASGGIGAACAALFAQAGYKCAVQYRANPEALTPLCAQYQDIFSIAADLTDPAQARRCVSLASYHLGKIENIVYCAGTAGQEAFCALTDEDFTVMYEVRAMMFSFLVMKRVCRVEQSRRRKSLQERASRLIAYPACPPETA